MRTSAAGHVHLHRQGRARRADVERGHGHDHREAVAFGDSYTVDAGLTLSTTAGSGVLANDRGSALATNTVVSGPAHGALGLNADGSFNYTANAGFSGTDSFTYNDVDAISQVSNTVTVTITVRPVAQADAYATTTNTAITRTAGRACSPTTWARAHRERRRRGPAHGTLTVNSDGSFTYNPTAGFSGIDSFTYNDKDAPGRCRTPRRCCSRSARSRCRRLHAQRRQHAEHDRGDGHPRERQGHIAHDRVDRGGTDEGHFDRRERWLVPVHAERGFSGTDSFTYNAQDPTTLLTNTVAVTLVVKPVA